MTRIMLDSRRTLLASIGALLIAACAPATRAGSSVVPGLMIRYDHGARPDTIVFQRAVTRGGRDSLAGTRTVVLRVVAPAASPRLLEVEQRFPGGGGEIVDTADAELHTLRAVAHRSHQPSRTMRFDFTTAAAEGSVAAGDSV